ncbi:alpha-galactosidase [Clostridium sp. DL1XJH146]
MSIIFNENNKIFHLKSKESSYIIKILDSGYLTHLYWGKALRNNNFQHMFISEFKDYTAWVDLKNNLSLDLLPQEYPSYGSSDFRKPAFQIQLQNGTTISDLKYKSHKIYKGKLILEGLPSTYLNNDDEGDTLEIELLDELIDMRVVLIYTVFNDMNVITRSTKFINDSEENISLLSALSTSVDFNDSNFNMLQLSGAWSRERWIEKRELKPGVQSIESTRGASSHQQNPFIALMRKDAGEHQGEVFGFNFVYSGNFIAQVEVDSFSRSRVTMGINPFDFSWLLEPSEEFQTPEVVMVYSDKGLNGLSHNYHKLYKNNLCRGYHKDELRPVLVNNWEATYFDFSSEKLLGIAKVAKELGIELFVLDDGWFNERNNDTSSLGDWFVDKEKLPEGLGELAKSVNDLGLKFGLWFEPEMVSPNSDLYREHPDWCIHVPGRRRSESRSQLVLDLSREDVCDYIINVVSNILNSANISYVKWDMNRHMTEIGSALLSFERQREVAHRYILGLYKILDKITSEFPEILFESCSGGGGRFDAGLLYYMPQTWTSDNTDAVERLKIQYGTSVVYPQVTMGAHVSAVPNHQVNRITSLKTRGNTSMCANLGYELDLTKLSEEEKEEIKEQIDWYKENRELIQFGDFYRLHSPFEQNETAWMIISEDKSECLVYFYKVLATPHTFGFNLKLVGLDKNMLYKLLENNEFYGGDELMYAGIYLPNMKGDYISKVLHFKKSNKNEMQKVQ